MKLKQSFLFAVATDTLQEGGGSPGVQETSGISSADMPELLGFGQKPEPSTPSPTDVDNKGASSASIEDMILAATGGVGVPKKGDLAPSIETQKKDDGGGEQAGFDFVKWFAEKYPETPDPTKIAKAEDWKSARGIALKAFEDVKALSIAKLQLEQRIASYEKGGKPSSTALPETEAVKALQVQIEQLRQENSAKMAEYEKFKASQDLASNPAFQAEYDGKRAGLMEEMKGIAQEAKISQEVIDAALAARSTFQLAKALEDIDDPTARRLLEDRANKFIEITNKRETALKGDAFSELAKWQDYEETMRGNLGLAFNENLKAQLYSAVPDVEEELGGDDGDVFFRLPIGQIAMQEIAANLEAGKMPTPRDAVRHMALAKMGEFYAEMSQSLLEQLNSAKAMAEQKDKELERYARMEPNGQGSGVSDGGAGGGFDIAAMFESTRR